MSLLRDGGAPYLQRIQLVPERVESFDAYPFALPVIRNLFFRAEFVSHFAQLLDERKADPWFSADPYARYGKAPILQRSHGEGFLSIMQNRIGDGLYLLDEPESALSPQRQLVLMALLADRATQGAQLVVATHSPILMTVPNSDILLIEDGVLRRVQLEDTEHYQVTKAVLANPAVFWKHLKPQDPDQ